MLTKALWLGIAAVSLIFLAGYVGIVSLGQVALYGIAGFTMANLVEADGGSSIAWNPWVATAAGILAATAVGLFLGAIASRSYGIYFLMITLAFGVLVYYFFAQVTELSGFGGVNNVQPPALIGNPLQDPAPPLLRRAGHLRRRLRAPPLRRASAARARVPGRARRPVPDAGARVQRAAAADGRVRARRASSPRSPA